MKGPVLSVLVLLAGCSNGWGKTSDEAAKACAQQYVRAAAALGREPMVLEQEWLAICVPPIAAAIEPCREHKLGSDSALQCMGRYGDPVLQDALAEFRHAEAGKYTALRQRVVAMSESDRSTWCEGADRRAAEKEACASAIKQAQIEKDLRDPKKQKKDAVFGLDL